MRTKAHENCSCKPCDTPARGVPGMDHCAACCYGSLIEEYDLFCVVSEHRNLASLQFGVVGEVSDG